MIFSYVIGNFWTLYLPCSARYWLAEDACKPLGHQRYIIQGVGSLSLHIFKILSSCVFKSVHSTVICYISTELATL